MANVWADDEVERLKVMWAEGLSASQVARALGGSHTRSSVIGKVHRLGLAGRSPARSSIVRSSPGYVKPPKPPKAQPLPPEPPPVAAEPLVLESGEFVNTETATDANCRWPIGDPTSDDFHFCGNSVKYRHSYCEAHERKAHQPSMARKQKSNESRVYR